MTAHGDSNGFRHLVSLHTSKNPKVRVIYLFMKTCHTQLLLAPGIRVAGGQADLVRATAAGSVRVAAAWSRRLGLWGSPPSTQRVETACALESEVGIFCISE